LRNERIKFAIPDELIASDQREMQRPKTVGDFENAIDKFLAFPIVQVAEYGTPTQVSFVIGITSRAAKRALPGNLNR
jgi:hypothetical protein